ncbi:fimbrial protein [Rahnella selenatireducens]|uniref:fimbrial protein n=1 Tax=Rahnella selenatireducens TaxID=3389797 RepID=UPI003968FB36
MKLTSIFRPAVVTIVLPLIVFNTFAADNVTINVTGKVIASPCTTVNGSSATLSVNLGDTIQANSLAEAGSGTELKAFDLPLTGCPASTTNVKATFTGTADTEASLWKNTAASPAVNTAVELTEQDAPTVPLGNNATLTEPVTAGNVTFKLAARALSKLGSVTPGDIASTIVVSFEYQ